MSKQEIAEVIERKAAEYGFEIERYTTSWSTRQTRESYVRIDILEKENDEKSSWEDRKAWRDIKASGSICQMGGDETPEELLKAAEEIARGARFAAELNSLGLSYTYTF